jgi:hypothetical protein
MGDTNNSIEPGGLIAKPNVYQPHTLVLPVINMQLKNLLLRYKGTIFVNQQDAMFVAPM